MIELHIGLEPFAGKEKAFERLFAAAYLPGISGQAGFRRATLLKKMEALREYEIRIAFDSEPLRLKWVASKEHAAVWPKVQALCSRISWAGWDIVEGQA